MGYWSEDILGGDGPLDFLWQIRDKVEKIMNEKLDRGYYPIDEASDRDLELTRTAMNSSWLMFEPLCEDDEEILTLAVMAMAAGAKLDTIFRDRAIYAARKDEWAKENDARRKVMTHFITQIVHYKDGQATVWHHEGLLEKLGRLEG